MNGEKKVARSFSDASAAPEKEIYYPTKMAGVCCESCHTGEYTREGICPNCGFVREQDRGEEDTRLAWARVDHFLEWCERFGNRDDEDVDDDDDSCQQCDSGKPSQYWDFEWGCEVCLKPLKLCPLCQTDDREKEEQPLCLRCTDRVKSLPNLVERGCGHWTLPCTHYNPRESGLAHPDQSYCNTTAMECILCEEAVCVRDYYETLKNMPKSYEAIRGEYVRFLGQDHVETFMFCSVCI